MRHKPLLVALSALLLAVPAHAQEIPFEKRVFNEQVFRPSGQPVVPLFDGWFENPDGTYGICFGYFNLNTEEAVDIPLGPDNFVEPAELDGLQPTHFDSVPAAGYRRHFCVFSVTGPEDFGDGRVVWTLRRNGETVRTPGKLIGPYVLDEPETEARGVVAPLLELDPSGPAFRGRTGHTAELRTVAVGEPLDLTVRVDHPAPQSCGRRGVDEMSHMWVGLTDLKQEELDWLVAERESGQSSENNESESSGRR